MDCSSCRPGDAELSPGQRTLRRSPIAERRSVAKTSWGTKQHQPREDLGEGVEIGRRTVVKNTLRKNDGNRRSCGGDKKIGCGRLQHNVANNRRKPVRGTLHEALPAGFRRRMSPDARSRSCRHRRRKAVSSSHTEGERGRGQQNQRDTPALVARTAGLCEPQHDRLLRTTKLKTNITRALRTSFENSQT